MMVFFFLHQREAERYRETGRRKLVENIFHKFPVNPDFYVEKKNNRWHFKIDGNIDQHGNKLIIITTQPILTDSWKLK